MMGVLVRFSFLSISFRYGGQNLSIVTKTDSFGEGGGGGKFWSEM